MKTSSKGRDLIRHFEGDRLTSYRCPAGVWTISVGHTGPDVCPNMRITEQQSQDLFSKDLLFFEKAVTDLVDVNITQDQFDALVSLTFNIGKEALRSSTLLKLLNQKQYDQIPAQLLRWNRGGGKVLDGLTRRRMAEGTLFSTGQLKF